MSCNLQLELMLCFRNASVSHRTSYQKLVLYNYYPLLCVQSPVIVLFPCRGSTRIIKLQAKGNQYSMSSQTSVRQIYLFEFAFNQSYAQTSLRLFPDVVQYLNHCLILCAHYSSVSLFTFVLFRWCYVLCGLV